MAHEAGHFMLADDHYNENAPPDHGWEFTLMGDTWNVNAATVQDVTEVLDFNAALPGCGCR